ncbi:MAG: glycosyltransferase family 2 protein [Candidatus Omnitrophica bacterium]|nr:glycosyltransferase family 2 protein [Candidatus Omnitrophota bacterium]
MIIKYCVVIPTYNEAKEIGAIIWRLREHNLDVLVVDDGSKDDTAKIARNAGANVLINKKNEGKGKALIKGFEWCLKNGFDAVLVMDGDGQHHPDDVKLFLDAAESKNAAFFLGNRMHSSKGMPLIRWLTNVFMSLLISCVAGQKISDSQCGFRLLKKELLQKLDLKSAKYEIESEMLIKASRLGYEIVPVNIQCIYRDQKSKISPFIDTLRFIRFIFGQIIWISPH